MALTKSGAPFFIDLSESCLQLVRKEARREKLLHEDYFFLAAPFLELLLFHSGSHTRV